MQRSHGIPVIALTALCALHAGLSWAASSIPDQAIANLRKVRSFRYSLKLSRTEPPLVSGEFYGAVVLPDTFEQEGSWQGQPRTQTRARGEIEYVRQVPDSASATSVDTAWSVLQRGEEADFLAQVEQALARDSFTFTGQDGSVQEYSFPPNVPFLDPQFNKQFSGRISILSTQNPKPKTQNPLRPLPVEISITSSDKTVAWLARFSDYDQVPPIVFPFVGQWRISLLSSPPSAIPAPTAAIRNPQPSIQNPKPKTQNAKPPDSLIIRQRFAAHGRQTRFEQHGDTMQILLEKEIRDNLLQGLIQPGVAEIWIARRPLFKGALPSGARRLPMSGDTTQKMIAEKLALTRQDINAAAVIDSSPGGILRLSLTRGGSGNAGRHNKLANSGMYWALVMDDAVVAMAEITRRPRADQIDLVGAENLLATTRLKTILDSPVLARHWQVVSVEKLPFK